MRLAILGSGFISRFYADALVAQRRKDVIVSVYSRTEVNAKKFAADYNVPHYTTSIKECVEYKDVDAVIIGLSNDMHLEAVLASAAAGKHVLCTKPLGRTASEALADVTGSGKSQCGGWLPGRSLLHAKIPEITGRSKEWQYWGSDLDKKPGNTSRAAQRLVLG